MARILLSSFGSYGDVHPVLGLAVALRDRGHDPVLALPAFYRDDAHALGLELRPVRPDLDLEDRAMVARVMHPRSGPRYLLSRLVGPAVRDSFQDLDAAARDADFMVTHPVLPAGPVVAVARGLPWASLALAPLSFFSAYDPPVPPMASPAGALLRRSPRLARLVIRGVDRVSGRWARPVAGLRRELGLEPGGNPYLAGQHSPHLVLALFSRLLAEPQPDWPPRARVTGPVLFNGRADRPAMTDDLARFLDDGDPPVVFTLGSSAVAVAGPFYTEAVAAARRIGRRAVLLTGRRPENRPRAAPGDDWLAVDWADHAALFSRAAAVVHQAGAGTLHQALRAGRPQLAVPHGYDQPDNAARAARLGVARVVAPRRFRARRVARELARLLDDPGYPRRAEDAAAIVAGEPGADGAADAIDALVD